MPCFEQILVDPSRSSKQILDISQGSKCCRALQTCMIRICVQNAQISIYFNMAAMHYASKAVGQRLPICPLRTANSEVESNQTFQAMRFRERVGATLSPLNSLNDGVNPQTETRFSTFTNRADLPRFLRQPRS